MKPVYYYYYDAVLVRVAHGKAFEQEKATRYLVILIASC